MKDKLPLVSILMTIYNHEKFLIKSIRSVINQSFKNWELIAIENGSNDFSKKILMNINDRRIRKKFLKKNIGRTNCLNYGLKLCRGDYIAILDSDDIAKINRISLQVNFLKKNKKIDLIAGNYNLIDVDGNVIKSVKNSNLYKKNPRQIIYKNLIAHSSIMFKKKMITLIGNYPKKFIYSQDYAFILKIFKKFNIFILDKILVDCRLHNNTEFHRRNKTGLIFKEEINLLIWSLKNFKLSMAEKLLVYFQIIKKGLIYFIKLTLSLFH